MQKMLLGQNYSCLIILVIIFLKPIVLMDYWLNFGVDTIVKITVKGKAGYSMVLVVWP